MKNLIPSLDPLSGSAIVSAAKSESYTRSSISKAVRFLLDHMDPPLSSIVKRGSRVLLKVNMGCMGLRDPAERMTSHPLYVEAVVEALIDCGAIVTMGDDVSRARVYESIWIKTCMRDVAARTGARLVDFLQAGGREVRGHLLYPRTHFITNLVFEADVIVNAASCRSHVTVTMSGAIKNMFGVLLGKRKERLHAIFQDVRDFSRAVVDVHSLARPTVSFLDLTTVLEGDGVVNAVQCVGLILAGTDVVSLDTVAAHAIGYEKLTIWPTIYAAMAGFGCPNMENITIRGIDWAAFEKKSLVYPKPPRLLNESIWDRATRFASHTFLRPRPIVESALCSACGECTQRCPADAISLNAPTPARIDLDRCADCGCCIKTCPEGAVALGFSGFPGLVRKIKPPFAASIS